MFDKIAIVGAGQAGLQLGFELLAQGHQVTLYTDKSAADMLTSPPPPVPLQFAPSILFEEELGLDFWRQDRAAGIDGTRMTMFTPEGQKVFTIEAHLKVKGQTVDTRLKFSVWLQEFEKRGGTVVIQAVDIPILEKLANDFDAVFVGTGKGTMINLFEVDATKTVFDKPQRRIVLFYAVNCNTTFMDDANACGGNYSIIPGIGEFIISPFLSKENERIYYVMFEAVPGGPLDLFDWKGVPAEQLEKVKDYFKSHFPTLYDIIKDATLVNDEWNYAAITPTVRKPAGKLPSGKVVMAIGDVVILNDPILAQGLNGASKLSRFIAQKIASDPKAVFNEEWINETFEAYWAKAKYNNYITNSMLGEPEPHQKLLMFAASQNQEIANTIVNGFGEAHTLYPWFGDAAEAQKFLAKHNFVMPC